MGKSKVKELFITLMEKYLKETLKMIKKYLEFKLKLMIMKFILDNLIKEFDMVLES